MSDTGLKKCDNCGYNCASTDIFCGNCGKPFGSSMSGANYNSVTKTIPSRGLQQTPSTPGLHNTDTTIPAYISHPLPQPREKMNRVYPILIAILVLMLVSAGVVIGVLLGRGNSPGTNNTPSTTMPTNGNATAPVVATTPTVSSTQVSTSTQIPSPTQTTTTGNILYQADWSHGLSGWNGTSDWYVTSGVLRSNGSDYSGAVEPTIVAPYYVTGTSDYAVETKIQYIRGNNSPCIFISLRGSTGANGWQGYKGGVCDGVARIQMNDTILASTPYDPGTTVHTYRVEVKGTTINFYIDGGLAVTTQDNSVSSGGQVGLKALRVQIDVTEFKVIGL